VATTPFQPRLPSWPAAALIALCLSCASYPERTAEAYDAFRSGQFDTAIELYADPEVTGGEFLAGSEAGTVALAAGDWDRALAEFDRAARRVKEHEDRALVSAEAAAEQLGGFLLNESQLPYVGEGYERVLLHASLALVYLARGDVEGLWVETRRANRLLETEEALYAKQYAAGGLAHFLSALAYEMLDEPDNALIDYRRMLEKGVGEDLAGRAFVRVAERLGRLEDFPEWAERFGPPQEMAPGAAAVVLVAGLGLAPQKREASLTLPTPWGIARFAVPELKASGGAEPALTLELIDAGLAVQSTVLEDVERVMAENLSDRVGWLALRSVARAALRMAAREQLRKEVGIGAALLADVFTLVAERADLRSWTTLPAQFHAARAFVPAGVHGLVLRRAGASYDLGRFELLPGETLIVLARGVGARLHAYPIGGGRLDALPVFTDLATDGEAVSSDAPGVAVPAPVPSPAPSDQP